MMNYKQILLATDLSQASDQLVKQAKELSEQAKANLSVVHVLEHSPVAYGGEFSIPIEANLEQSLEASARNSLANLATKYKIDAPNVYVESGSVKLAVNKLAEKIQADLIIVGTHGHHGIDILLGSHANAILHMAKCDVLAIRLPTQEQKTE